MRPDEWRRGMEHEAASVEDRMWARNTLWAAWRQRRQAELGGVLTWRPLSRLLLALPLPGLLPATLNLWPPAWLDALLLLLRASWANGGLLLLVVWTVRYVHLGYAPWALALVGAGAGLIGAGLVLLTLLPADAPGPGPLLALLTGGALYNFILLWGLGWAITRLRPESKEHSI